MCNQRPKRSSLPSMEEMSANETSNHIDDSKYEEVNGHEEEEGGGGGGGGDEEKEERHEAAAAEDELFWSVLQSDLNVEIPSYVKNIMRMCHLDKPLSFRCIRDETIAELEKFVRKSMMYQLMGIEVKLEEYYGPFHKMPHKFHFAIGDRFLIKQLVACAKSKSDDYWKRALRPSRQQQSNVAATTTASPTSPTTTTTRRSVRYDRRATRSSNELAQEPQEPQDDATSELEEEEDRPAQDETPLNLDQERRKLLEIVRSSLLKEDFGDGVQPKDVAARVKVRVTLKSSEEYGTRRDIVTGFIKCVVCPTRLMIRKQAFGARKPRWVISNYRRHIRFHLDGKLRRPSPADFARPQQQQQRVSCKTEFFAVDVDNEPHADEQTDDPTTATDMDLFEEHDDQQ